MYLHKYNKPKSNVSMHSLFPIPDESMRAIKKNRTANKK